MVGIKFNGRLGNQLFQYVYFNYLKSIDQNKWYFFVNPHHGYLTKYFDLGFWHNIYFGSKILSVFARLIPKIFNFEEVYVHNFFEPKQPNVKEQTIINGYFQSDFYYNKLVNPQKIKIHDRFLKQFEELFGELFLNNKVVVVHIRRTDYLKYGKRDISLPIDFFKRQLDSIPNINSYKVVFISDDMTFVKENFISQPNYIFSENSEIIDFQLIQNAEIAIISNSTFAWWAAFLSSKNKLVIAPKNWFGFRIGREHPKGIMTSKFEWRDVI